MQLPAAVEPLADAWRSSLGRAPGRVAVATGLLVAWLVAWLARMGTIPARAVAAALCLCAIGLLLWRRGHEARVWASPRRTVDRVLRPADERLASRVLRMLGLVEAAERGGLVGSSELAEWQLRRVLGHVSLDAVRRAAAIRARKLGWLTAALLTLLAVGLLPGPFRLLEGYDVLLATRGRAPVPLWWLDSLRVTAQPPAYLRRPARTLLPGDQADLPVGSVITVTGVPRHPGRPLLLTDGTLEIPFVSDGRGGVVAHYTLDRGGELAIAARFGQVLVRQPEPLALGARADDPPEVVLDGAPRTVKLAELERLEILFRTTDDHGLKEVDLVLRAGLREDRRVLLRLDGETTSRSGGYALAAADPFLKRSVVPVTLTVEAKDNDSVRGPKWGQSAAITVVLPTAGEPEADRLHDLAAARSVLVDLLAWRLDPEHDGRQESERAGHAARSLREAVARSYGGLRVPAGLQGFLQGQARIVETLSSGTRAVPRLEGAILAVDVALRGLGERDARWVALRLGELCKEVAEAAQVAQSTERRSAALDRLGSSLAALGQGIGQLLRLGELGADLGSVARADFGRIKNARQRDDLWHVELAARHLAARLGHANPSFATAWHGGVEAGGVADVDSRNASEADKRFDELMHELAELAREHGTSLDGLERALGEGEASGLNEGLRAEANERADALRELAEQLPGPGEDSSTARGAAGIARQQVEAMADELERLGLRRAQESGRAALGSLDQASKQAKSDARELDAELVRQVAQRVRSELGWTEQRLQELGRESAAGMRAPLDQAARREQELGERTGALAERGHAAEAPLSAEAAHDLDRAADLMRDAAGDLRQGRGDRGLKLGRAAQDLLERLNKGRTTDTDQGESSSSGPAQSAGGTRSADGNGYVPDRATDRTQGFRRRVLEGLGQARKGRLGPAVERYAEGLLR
jgi:hypothetical protein